MWRHMPEEEKQKRKAGRPHKELDLEQIRELAMIQCTNGEIAAVMRCSVDTLHDNYYEIIKDAREAGKCSLRRAQWKKAVVDGNPALLIWLGKFILGQKDEMIIKSEEPAVRQLLEQWEKFAKSKASKIPYKDRV